jgi:hypothetical protein
MLGAYVLLMLYFRRRGGYRAVALPTTPSAGGGSAV